MAGASGRPAAGDDPSVLRRRLGALTELLNNAGTIVIAIGMVIVCTDVAARNFFNSPFFGVPELMKMTIIAIVFFQLPHAVLSSRMIRSDVLLESLPAGPSRVLNTFHMVAGALFTGAIAWGVFPELVEAIRRNTFVGLWVGFRAPVWPIRLIIFGGAALACVVYALNALVGERRQ